MSGLSVAFLGIYRFLLPLVLLAAAILRVNSISLGYLIIVLVWAALPVNSRRPVGGIVLAFFGVIISCIGLLGQAAFQIVLVTDYKDDLAPCTSMQRLWQQIGFNLMNEFDYKDFLRYLLPDVGVFITCLLAIILGLKARRQQSGEQSRDAEGCQDTQSNQQSHTFVSRVILAHNILFSLSLFVAAVILPSILTGMYFLVLLTIGIVWSLYLSFPTILHWTKLLTVLYSALHLFVMYIYQFYALQNEFPPESKWMRLFGLTDISNAISCNDNHPWKFTSGSHVEWRDYVSPIAVLLLYFVTTYEIHIVRLVPTGKPTNSDDTADQTDRWWLNPKSRRRPHSSGHTSALLAGSTPKRYSSMEVMAATSSKEIVDQPEDETERTGSVRVRVEESGWSKFHKICGIIYMLAMENSWHVAVIVMIAWSIIFISWMTFVLLVWACVIWMHNHSRILCQYSSPLVVLYSLALVIGQYVYSLDGINDLHLLDDKEQIGFTSKWANLLPVQIVFVWIFWLTQRQFFYEMKSKKSGKASTITLADLRKTFTSAGSTSPEKDFLANALDWIIKFIYEYWVLLCFAVFLLVSLTVEVSVMRFVYMAFFLLLLGFFQLSRALYKIIITPMWWLVAIYSLLFVWMLYIFQLDVVYDELTKAAYGDNITQAEIDNKTLLSDIGLKRFDSGELFVNMLTPTVALIVVILQLKYFHRRVRGQPVQEAKPEDSQIEDLSRKKTTPTIAPETTQEASVQASADLKDDGSLQEEEPELTHQNLRWLFWNALSRFVVRLTAVVLRILELYLSSGLLLCIFIVAIQQVSAIELPVVIIICFCIMTTGFRKLFYFCFMVWTSLTITAKMLYQLNFVEVDNKKYSCGNVSFTNGMVLAEWFGLKKVSCIGCYIAGYIVIVVLIALVVTVQRHQNDSSQTKPAAELPEERALFLQVTRVETDNDLTSAFKYLVNNFFDMFGMKLCFLAFAIVGAVRLDVYGLFYCLLLALLLVVSNPCRRILWPVVTIIVSICLWVEYALLVGMPPIMCHFYEKNYPWIPSQKNIGLLGWLYLPVFRPSLEQRLRSLHPLSKWFLVGDFVLLLLLGFQWALYRWKERQHTTSPSKLLDPSTAKSSYEPPDFTFPDTKSSWQRLWLDYVKIVIFKYAYWFTVLMIFLTGVNRISVFCLGYILFAFIILWIGQKQLTFSEKSLRLLWNCVLLYNMLVIIAKVALQELACVHSNVVPCGLVKLFNIVCLNRHLYQKDLGITLEFGTCKSGIDIDSTGLALDVASFGFILIQRYIFQTQYFHLIQKEVRWYISNLKTGAIMVTQATRYMRNKLKAAEEERNEIIRAHVEKLKQDHQIFQFLYAGTKLVDGITEADHPSLTDKDTIDPALAAAIDKESLQSEPADTKEVNVDIDPTSDLSTLQKIKLTLLDVVEQLTLWLQSVSASYRAVTITLEDMRKKEAEQQNGVERSSMEEISEEVGRPIFKSENEEPKSLIDEFLQSDIEHPDNAERAKKLREKLKDGLVNVTSHFTKLVKSLYYAIVSRTDLICYLIMIINFTVQGNALSLPLPLFVFFWGLLSVPRPSKTFWIVVELYVMILIVIRYICQSTLIPLKESDGKPLKWTTYVGIEQGGDFTARSIADFAVLWAVAIHIAKLQLRGLWLGSEDQTATDGLREDSIVVDDDDDDDSDDGNEASVAESGKDTKKNPCSSFLHVVRVFFHRAVSNDCSSGWRDYYTLMFLVEVLCFVITVFGWSSFGQASENVASYLEQNYIPVPFIAMLIVQFLLLLVDRLLYRSGWAFGKLILNFAVVIVVHIWVFLILPLVTKRSFVGNTVVQTWYFFKCMYMGLSSAQIAAGYPPRRSGNFLMDTKRYPVSKGRVIQVLFVLPFYTELRELMDWCVANTTLEIMQWLKVQDIWYEMFLVKCKRVREELNPRTMGDRQPPITKFIIGTVLILVLVIVLWFPLLWISLVNSSAVANRPTEVSVELSLAGYEPLFRFTANDQNIHTLNSDQYNLLKNRYSSSDEQKAMFTRYKKGDISRILIPNGSGSLWIISPPTRKLLANTLANSTSIVNLDFQWSITRNPPTGLIAQVVNGKRNISYDEGNSTRIAIADMLLNDSRIVAELPNLFPVFISAPANKKSIQLSAFKNMNTSWANCSLSLNSSTEKEWWNLMQTSEHVLPDLPGSRDAHALEIIIFSEPVAPPVFSFFAGSSVIGLYISIVLVIGQFLKGFTKGISHKIIYEDVPEPADIVRLCEDIFLVREFGPEGLQLEEMLVGKLFFLYRSPERLIEWTRIRQQ
ncbi:piezo-type mechanosensitive ion channel component 1-like isoform X2 [Corticium candelabrum]|uniref:piezo-type mechanosensitive ion channel component 1-like isoform X2 n=1 Tax=Corticium candelabrum TaxID=121492 RepID=UPI002E263F64|nr:piezo-type mechanosensitive ion channel component 1-like isoform X2 [Corticium candelabrum]